MQGEFHKGTRGDIRLLSPPQYIVIQFLATEGIVMRVEKAKFDSVLSKLIKAKPEPRKAIKTTGKPGTDGKFSCISAV